MLYQTGFSKVSVKQGSKKDVGFFFFFSFFLVYSKFLRQPDLLEEITNSGLCKHSAQEASMELFLVPANLPSR